MKADSCIAMLLAGGEGRRLSPLTANVAKPAVPFGGYCRIIDYTLSNCIHSEIGTIGVLTQYQSESLHRHIGDGKAWRKKGTGRTDIALLPSGRKGGEGYMGTADAIYQNMDFIDRCRPEHVLVLSGDHIYQMDYRELMQAHIAGGAAATIAVKRVPWKEASRFGIMNTDESMRVVDFVEKPKDPQSNLASMGIYMFRWSELKRLLIEDRNRLDSSHDFGKDIIPGMLREGIGLQAFRFDGYWRDVGTVESLWEAHMNLIDGEIAATGAPLNAGAWPILSRERRQEFDSGHCPKAEVLNSYVHSGSSVEGDVERSVIFGGVSIGQGADVRESIVMPGARIGRDAWIYRAIIGEGAIVEDGAVIGSLNGDITVIVAEERGAEISRLAVSPARITGEFFADHDWFPQPLSLEKART